MQDTTKMLTVKDLLDYLSTRNSDDVIQLCINDRWTNSPHVELRTVVSDVAFDGDYTRIVHAAA